MVSIILLWFFMSITAIPIGFGIHLFYAKRMGINIENSILPIDHYIILGFIVITTFLAYFSLFFKISLLADIIIIIISIIILIFNFEKFKYLYKKTIALFITNYSILLLFSFLIVIIVLLLFAISSPVNYDTGLYHSQAIQWINEFGVIPGLGNLHGRLAFNSHFFLISALYDFSFLSDIFKKIFPFYSVCSFLLLILVIREIFLIFKSIKKEAGFYVMFHLVILLSSLWLFLKTISSPTPDTAVAILIIYILSIFVSNLRNNNAFMPYILICLAFFIPTVKLSSMFIIILLPFLLKKIDYKSISSTVFLGLIIFFPFIIRNIALSGYLIYPFASIDLFSVDWKIPLQSVLSEENSIKNWAKVAGQILPDSKGYISFKQWFIPWLLDLRPDAVILLALNILSPIGFFFHSKLPKIFKRKYIIVGVVSLINIYFCFITAPSLRFVYGFMIFNMSLFIALLFSRILKINFKPAVFSSVVIFLICITLAGIIKHTEINAGQLLKKNLVFAEQIQKTEVQTISIDSIEIRILVTGDRCFNTPIPCTPYYNKNLGLRGKQLSDGFKILHSH